VERLIGVFGGTFDPPHIGHLILAVEAHYQLELERVLWVLTADPPHKPEAPLTATEIRLEMLKISMGNRPEFELSRVDIDRPGPHFAVDTLRLLSEAHPGEQWAYLMGGDSLRDMFRWHDPAGFLSRCDLLAVMPRPEAPPDLASLQQDLPEIEQKLRFLRAPSVALSSSDVRRRVRQGQPFEHLLTAGVAQLIRSQGLYR
jgi:nicotinate-nucleotide adenylyltransferase